MTEIRPIRAGEADRFLTLLCDVFGLDFNRAHEVFFTEPMFDLQRKWALFEDDKIVSILTTTPLEFGWGRAFGIAGVATRQDRQGEGLASRLLQHVLEASIRSGESAGLLFAKDVKLYRRNGFVVLDQVVRSSMETGQCSLQDAMLFDDIQVRYDQWASSNPARLRRNERRWNYWRWHYRICTALEDGYVCSEPGVLREAIVSQPGVPLPLPRGTEWFGTTHMAGELGIALREPNPELFLMGRDVPEMPQMFMTDQF